MFVKLGNNVSALVPAQGVAGIKVAGQAILASSAMQILGPVAIPVLPIGAGASYALHLLEYMVNKALEDFFSRNFRWPYQDSS